ncbi:MAG: class II aldolase/adducin family protein [Gallionella sp.]|nr:class II aldolase/adducin family protein [Gallionella sp.]MDD4959475.1 class II aldolase/adducin family protein [Gallionella sp.]
MTELNLHRELVQMAQKLEALGLNHGTAGNLSVRSGEGFLITPSGMSTAELTEADLVWVGMDGQSQGRWQPSSEWLFHRDILVRRPEFNAVIHTHSVAASTLACMRRDIPPFHYMVALLGGDSIRCADYATFGTQALSDNALRAMEHRKACLLANHGMIAAGKDLADALKMTIEVENLSELYVRTLQLGEPVLLTPAEFAEAQAKFTYYGKRQTAG